VASAFIPNPDSLSDVDHKDFDKSNNRAANLRWVTHQENIQHAADHQRMAFSNGEGNHMAVLTNAQVRKIRALQGRHIYGTIAAMFGVSKTCIGGIIRRETWKNI
jgi:hypothetical protein